MLPFIIGYGSPLRGDDGVAWRIIDALNASMERPQVNTVAIHQLVPELAEEISRAGLVIFVDATDGELPGEINVFPLEAAPLRRGSHQTTPQGLLDLAADLFGKRMPAYMITISGESFALSEELSVAASEAVPKAVAMILALINKKSADPAE